MVIEILPWQAFFDRYDRPSTLYYLDPPYWGSESDCGKELFGRDLFAGFHQQKVELTYSVSGGGKSSPARELIITPWKPTTD